MTTNCWTASKNSSTGNDCHCPDADEQMIDDEQRRLIEDYHSCVCPNKREVNSKKMNLQFAKAFKRSYPMSYSLL